MLKSASTSSAPSEPRETSRSLLARELMVFGLLVLAGIAARLYFQHIPNFAPVAAVALFAGFFFRSMWAAALVPLTIMVISDQIVGGYEWQLMLVVYGMLTVPVLLRAGVRRLDAVRNQRLWGSQASLSLAGLLASSLACSIAFFVVTNAACWAFTPWYSRDLAGLTQCFVGAWPFFRYTIAGDATFGLLLFGSYALLSRLAASREALPAWLRTFVASS